MGAAKPAFERVLAGKKKGENASLRICMLPVACWIRLVSKGFLSGRRNHAAGDANGADEDEKQQRLLQLAEAAALECRLAETNEVLSAIFGKDWPGKGPATNVVTELLLALHVQHADDLVERVVKKR